MFGVISKIIGESMPCRARKDYWRRALTPAGVAALLLAPVAVMVAIGWAIQMDLSDPTWMAIAIIPIALTVANLGLDDVIKRGRRELRRGLSLTADRIRELARTAYLEIQKAYQIGINDNADRTTARPDQDREAVHLPPPRPRLVSLTLSPRLLPVPRARASHDKGIGRA